MAGFHLTRHRMRPRVASSWVFSQGWCFPFLGNLPYTIAKPKLDQPTYTDKTLGT
jgi:hypothetical protein